MTAINKKVIIKSAIVFTVAFLLFFGLTIFSNRVLTAYDVTSVRLSPVLNPILGIAFGWPGALGCAIANTVSDIISGYKPLVCVLGTLSQILYGILPYYIWKFIVRSKSHITRLDSPRKTIYFVILMLFNSLIVALFVGLFQLYTSNDKFFDTFIFAFVNDFDVCVVIGLPLMALIDHVYSKHHQVRKRELSYNERFIVLCGLCELISFVITAIITCSVYQSFTTPNVWKQVFINSIITMNAILVLFIVLMYIFGYYRKKNTGLKIIEKSNGTIYVNEQKHIEFVSYPSVDFKDRIKSSIYNNTYESITKNFHPRYEKCWVTTVSSQRGCPMKCSFCDCPANGYHGNVSREDFKYQIENIINNVGVTSTNLFLVEFMRMGEPTFNNDLLPFIEFDLKNIVQNKVNVDTIYPYISTMLPKANKDKNKQFLLEYCRIKNEVYNGNAGLQFSINTTDEATRKKIFRNMSMSLEEISELSNLLPLPKGKKYALNFAITKESTIDVEKLDKLFDKNKFAIKLTPIHQTFNAIDNGLADASEYESNDVYKLFENKLISHGWEVQIYQDSIEEDNDALTCGNSILANMSEKIAPSNRIKKKIGLCVAIEIDAIFEMYPDYIELPSPKGFKLYSIKRETYELYVLKTGMGEVAASSGVSYLVAKFGVSLIINFGVVGGLTPEMKKEKICLVNQVVHYKYDCSEFMDLKIGQVDGHDSIYLKTDEKLVDNVLTLMDGIKLVTCCSGDKFVSTAEEKSYLHKKFNGDICDMESSGIVLASEINDVPCLLLKAVSDGLNDGAEGFYAELNKASLKCLKVAEKIIDKLSKIQ